MSGFFALVLDPDHFVSRRALGEITEQLVGALKSSKKAPGVSEILVPGERLVRERNKRLAEGIPVDEVSWQQIALTLDRLGVCYPGE